MSSDHRYRIGAFQGAAKMSRDKTSCSAETKPALVPQKRSAIGQSNPKPQSAHDPMLPDEPTSTVEQLGTNTKALSMTMDEILQRRSRNQCPKEATI
jgi:hypothetical protein